VTSCSQSRSSTRLSYTPNVIGKTRIERGTPRAQRECSIRLSHFLNADEAGVAAITKVGLPPRNSDAGWNGASLAYFAAV
jgi:hypothetical protein